MLLDADGSVVYGRPALLPGTRRIPVEAGERTVGHLALLAGTPLSEQVELSFLEQQSGALLVGAALMLALSAALALPLAQRLLRPVRAFQAAARRLSAGEYAARIGVEREDELGQIGRDFNALAEALQRNEQARRQWVADISHELRTPLAVLRGELEALQDGIRPIDRAAVDSLHADVRRLSRLVDDLYELSMTDLGALSYRKEDTDPLAVLREDVDAFRPRFAEAGLGLTLESRLALPVTLAADPQRLSQLFRNLLANGLRYTDRGGRLEVTASIEARELLIDFADTPPGVPAEALPRLFDRLYRVDRSRSRETGGAGLGLAICRNIVEAHGGAITADPSPLGGLRVRVRLPL
jgi:two-component system sensor histidine kinase BaeS